MAGEFPLPRDSGSAHDWLYVGVRRNVAPGIVRSLNVKRAYDIDWKKPGSQDGATPTTNGEKPVDVDITLEFWDDVDDPAWARAVAAALGPLHSALFPEGKAPTPRDVAHPKLALHRIRSLFFYEWAGPDEIGFSHWQVKLKAGNYKPPIPGKTATNTPRASSPLATGNVLFAPKGAPPATSSIFQPWTPPKSPDASNPRP